MKLPEGKRRVYFIAACVVSAIAVAAALPGYMKKTGTAEYCASCHVMLPEYDDWFYTGKHTQIQCIDCHLPNDTFINHYMWKGLDGVKDVVYFYSGLVSETIHSSSHAKKTIQANCIRCHEEMVSRISTDTMRCWECHRKLLHIKINEY